MKVTVRDDTALLPYYCTSVREVHTPGHATPLTPM